MQVLTFFTALLLSAACAHAAPGYGPGPGKGDHFDRMRQELGLTDEQVAQMRQIRQEGGSREEIHAVLTEEQRAKADAWHAQHQGQRAERRERMQQELGLSDEQMAQMKAIRERGGSREEMRAVLTEEQQAKMAEMRRDRPMMGNPHIPQAE